MHVMVADISKSFDTVDNSSLDCAIGSPGGSVWFLLLLFMPLGVRHLDALSDVKPQLYVDNLKCSAERPRALFESARFIARYVRSVVRTFLLVISLFGEL